MRDANTEGYEELDLIDMTGLIDTVLPEPTLVEFYRNLKERELVWNGEIDDSMIEIGMYIRKWNREDKGLPAEERKPIKLFINSDGGYVDTVMNVINIIEVSKTPVYTIGLGRVYSAGGLLLMAGHKRYIFKDTTCLIHDGSSAAFGNIGKLIDSLEFTRKRESKMKDYILSRTKITEEEYDDNYRKDWFIFANEMISYGIADEIITDIDVVV